ncbi:MAG: hypothetical protein IJJ85_09730, partial [Clostridia bacterium]|nr:hypothetical protein [Clostridia bacterium]
FFWQVPLFFYFVILTVFCNFFRHFDEFFPSVILTNTRGFLSLAELLRSAGEFLYPNPHNCLQLCA